MGFAIIAAVILVFVAFTWYVVSSIVKSETDLGAKLAGLAGGIVVAVLIVVVARAVLGSSVVVSDNPAARSPIALAAGKAGGAAGGLFLGLLLCSVAGWGFGFGDLRWEVARCLIIGSLMALGGHWYGKMVSPPVPIWVAFLAHIIMVKAAWWEFGRLEIVATALTTGAGAMAGMVVGPFVFVILMAVALGWYVGMWIMEAMPDGEE